MWDLSISLMLYPPLKWQNGTAFWGLAKALFRIFMFFFYKFCLLFSSKKDHFHWKLLIFFHCHHYYRCNYCHCIDIVMINYCCSREKGMGMSRDMEGRGVGEEKISVSIDMKTLVDSYSVPPVFPKKKCSVVGYTIWLQIPPTWICLFRSGVLFLSSSCAILYCLYSFVFLTETLVIESSFILFLWICLFILTS